MAKFDDRTLRNFENYLKLQQSGEMNMVSAGVRERLGISKEEHLFILENYSEIKKEYENLKVVDEVLQDAKARVNSGETMSKDFKPKEAEHGDIQQ